MMEVNLNTLSDIEIVSDNQLIRLIDHTESFRATGLVDEISPIRKLAMLHYGSDTALHMALVFRSNKGAG